MKICARCYQDTIAICSHCGAGQCHTCSSQPCALCSYQSSYQSPAAPAPVMPTIPPLGSAIPSPRRPRRRRPAGLQPVLATRKPTGQKQKKPTGYQPRYPRTRPARKPFDQMDKDEGLAFLRQEQAWLIEKQIREQSYLMRRQRNNTYTPTDQAYEADQDHEDDLIAFLQHLINQA